MFSEAGKRAGVGQSRACLPAIFVVKDSPTHKDWTERFDNLINIGLFHVVGDEDRRDYVEGLATVLKLVVGYSCNASRMGSHGRGAKASVEAGIARRLLRRMEHPVY